MVTSPAPSSVEETILWPESSDSCDRDERSRDGAGLWTAGDPGVRPCCGDNSHVTHQRIQVSATTTQPDRSSFLSPHVRTLLTGPPPVAYREWSDRPMEHNRQLTKQDTWGQAASCEPVRTHPPPHTHTLFTCAHTHTHSPSTPAPGARTARAETAGHSAETDPECVPRGHDPRDPAR